MFTLTMDRLLRPAGFRRVRRGLHKGSYKRDAPPGQHGLGFGLRQYFGSIEVELGTVTVRYDAVEELVARYELHHPLVSPEDIAVRFTLGVKISHLEDEPPDPLARWGGVTRKVWMVQEEAQIDSVAEDLASYMLTKGEVQYRRLSNAEVALEILSRDDDDARSYRGPDSWRAKRAIALALQVRGKTAATQLVALKRAKLRGDERSEFLRWTSALLADQDLLRTFQQ